MASKVDIGAIDVTSAFSVKWRIDNFKSVIANRSENRIISPKFQMHFRSGAIEYRLCLYFCNVEGFASLKIGCGIILESDTTVPMLRVYFTLSNDHNDQLGKFAIEQCNLRKTANIDIVKGYVDKRFLEKPPVYTTDGQRFTIESRDFQITMSCTIEVIESQCRSTDRSEEFDDFEKLLENGQFHDFTFIVEGREFKVHKAILSCRSPVFAAMFEHDMRENQENKVEIEDVKCEVMRELLRFVYGGRVADRTAISAELLIAADKYSLQGLKQLCEDSLCDDLQLHNALKCLSAADLVNASKLKTQALTFIATKAQDIIDVPEFKSLGDLRSELVHQVVRAMVKRKDENNLNSAVSMMSLLSQ